MNPAREQRDRRLALAAALLATPASCAYALSAGATVDALVGPLLVSASFVITGNLAWARRPANPMGRLMVASGIFTLLVAFAGPPWLVLYPIGLAAHVIGSVLLGYLILAFPSGRLRSNLDRALVVLTAVLVGAPRAVGLFLLDPAARGRTW